MENTYLESGSLSSEFSFDSGLIDYNDSDPQLKQQVPTDCYLIATYNHSSIDADYSILNKTGTLNGAAVVSGNKLICTGTLTKGVYYSINNIGRGSCNFLYTPDYSGSPAANINMVSIREITGNNNRLALFHSPSGDNFRITLNDSAGVSVLSTITIGASGVGLVSGTEYEIELTWDNVTGNVYLMIDGILYGTLSPGPWSFVSNSARLYIGANPGIYDVADGSFNNILLYSLPQHIASYIPTPYYEFVISKPAFTLVNVISNVSKINSLSIVGTAPAGSSLKFVLNIDGQLKYWAGTAGWLNSTGVNESNDFDEAGIDFTSAINEGAADLNIVFYFVSNSIANPQIENFTIVYESIETAIITGYYRNPDKSVPENALVKVRAVSFTAIPIENLQIDSYTQKPITPDPITGKFTVELIINVEYVFIFYQGTKKTGAVKKTILTDGTINFS